MTIKGLKFIPDEVADAYAIQALVRGEANEHQQIRAFKCIVEELCGTYDMTFDPDSPRVSDFNEGKRHVGRALVGLTSLNLGKLKKEDQPKEQDPVKVNRKRGK